MKPITLESLVSPVPDQTRAESLIREQHSGICRQTDRLFIYLMLLQWIAGIVAAMIISPKAWAGTASQVHLHVWAAIFLGGAISAFPIILAQARPGQVFTRHVIAASQMLWSALLIHLTGGRIETHFHIFGSLAILAFYRDWRVVITASTIVAFDHFVRGLFWPLSGYGVLLVSPWRWLEHAAWVVFEVVFLIIAIRQSTADMLLVAQRQASLEAVNNRIEQEVAARTSELTAEIIERKRAEADIENLHRDLLDVSRQAGMAEVATNVLHNVGNVLNSVNVSAALVSDKTRNSKLVNLQKAAGLLTEHSHDLPTFLTTDPKGRQLPGYFADLSRHLLDERSGTLKELESLVKNVDHIKEIVSMQQGFATRAGVSESVAAVDLMEDALLLNDGALVRHEIKVTREYGQAPRILVERHKILQILVNLVRNAKFALDEGFSAEKQLTVRVALNGDTVQFSVIDNGVGISPENITRIFAHGFTTRPGGHGFGLHSGALAAKELHGSLTAHSKGAGQGATFVLELPCQKDPGDR